MDTVRRHIGAALMLAVSASTPVSAQQPQTAPPLDARAMSVGMTLSWLSGAVADLILMGEQCGIGEPGEWRKAVAVVDSAIASCATADTAYAQIVRSTDEERATNRSMLPSGPVTFATTVNVAARRPSYTPEKCRRMQDIGERQILENEFARMLRDVNRTGDASPVLGQACK